MKRAVSAALVTVAVTALAGCGTTINTNATSSGPAAPGIVSAAQVLPAGAQQVDTPQSSAGAGCTASLAPSGPLPAPGQMPTG
jgi:polar amino acid transport system substrate-binding protein